MLYLHMIQLHFALYRVYEKCSVSHAVLHDTHSDLRDIFMSLYQKRGKCAGRFTDVLR